MANLVVHFEIHASEPQLLIDFYSGLLSWRFTQFGDAPYGSIETGEGAIGNVAGSAGHGINGGLTQRRGPKPELGAPVMGCNIVIGVDDVDSLMRRGVELGGTDEQKPAKEGTVEAWGRSSANPIGGWYGLKKGLRGRFGVYLPPLMEALGLCELEHNQKNNRMRAK